jgi:demethylmenaquinone methyltransferase/2-methoxy-6-polyprenyl-1,4-benzoquinol methylase
MAPSPVQELFGRIARRYDLLNRVLSLGTDLRWRRRAAALLPASRGIALDLACGTGDLGRELLRQGRAARAFGCDFSLPMLRAGRGGLPLAAGDALRLPFGDAAFDLAAAAFGWRNFGDPAAALGELRRVLRPGGRLLLLEFFRPRGLWPRAFHATVARHLIPAVGGLLARDRAAYRYLQESIAGFLSVAEARELLSARGFAAQRWAACAGGIAHAVAAEASG